MARYQESQEIVRRLIQENKELRKQLEDARDEMFAMSLEEGRTLTNMSEKSWSKEIDNCTKEEVSSDNLTGTRSVCRLTSPSIRLYNLSRSCDHSSVS